MRRSAHPDICPTCGSDDAEYRWHDENPPTVFAVERSDETPHRCSDSFHGDDLRVEQFDPETTCWCEEDPNGYLGIVKPHPKCPVHSESESLKKYHTIVADPPWHYEGFATQSRTPGKWTGKVKSKPLPYGSMTVEAICDLPVADLAVMGAG